MLMKKNDHYNICFVDWEMPGMNGIELIRKIKEMNSDNKQVVIMISAFEWNIIENEVKEAGVDKFLAKPLFPSTIVDAISECLGDNSIEETQEETTDAEIFKNHTILLVEDVEVNREILFSLMEAAGAVFDGAGDGAEAVKLFSQNTYDLVLMDIHMPAMDGYTATRNIRASAQPWAKTVPIICISADSGADVTSKCLAAGMNDRLEKPVDMEILYKMIAAHMPAV